MLRSLSLVPALALAACAATPATGPHCPASAAKELATLGRLAAETERAVATGYRDADRPASSGFNLCLGSGHDNVGISFCTDGGSRGQKVAVDPQAERRKLENLADRRAEILARHPECAPAP